ncbi:MAG TPA: metalloregulator ArsR/SmtB family transcription factor [Aliidongia sp.]|nr:metalloregulator ArsR/SmtB family transcription factor [Aliidongia sp.]
MPSAVLPALLSFFKALADESRLKIIGVLASRESSGQELAALLGLKEPTVSHHLAVLKEQGLVRQRLDGNSRWWSLDLDALAALNRRIATRDEIATLADGIETDAWDRRVRDNFLLADGRLKEIPASRKKRWVILRFLVEQFEADRRYPEGELNEILKRHHWDSATLRREMIGYRMMARDHGVYWRLPEDAWLPA